MPKTIRNKGRATTLAANTPQGDPQNVTTLKAIARDAASGANWEHALNEWQRSEKWRQSKQLPNLPMCADPSVTLQAIPAALEENTRTRELYLARERKSIFQPSRTWPHGQVPASGTLLDAIKDEDASREVHKAILHFERNIGFRSVMVREGKVVASKIVNSERRTGQSLDKLASIARKAKGPLDATFYAAWLETPKSAKNLLIEAAGDKPLMGYPFTPNPADVLALMTRAKALAGKRTKESPVSRDAALVAILRAYKTVHGKHAPSKTEIVRFTQIVCDHYATLIPNLMEEFKRAIDSKSTLPKLREQATK